MSQDFSTPQKVKEYLSDQDIAFNDDMEFDYLQTLARRRKRKLDRANLSESARKSLF